MPDHVRKQIRDAVATAVTGLTTTGANVFPTRVYPAEENSLPCLLVFTGDESSERATIGGDPIIGRELDVAVEGLARDKSTLDDTLDTIAKEVEVAMDDADLSALVNDFTLSATELDYGGDGNQPIGSVRLTFKAMYRTTESDPTTSV